MDKVEQEKVLTIIQAELSTKDSGKTIYLKELVLTIGRKDINTQESGKTTRKKELVLYIMRTEINAQESSKTASLKELVLNIMRTEMNTQESTKTTREKAKGRFTGQMATKWKVSTRMTNRSVNTNSHVQTAAFEEESITTTAPTRSQTEQ